MTVREAIEQLDQAWWAAENEYGPSGRSFDDCIAALGHKQEHDKMKAEAIAEMEAREMADKTLGVGYCSHKSPA